MDTMKPGFSEWVVWALAMACCGVFLASNSVILHFIAFTGAYCGFKTGWRWATPPHFKSK